MPLEFQTEQEILARLNPRSIVRRSSDPASHTQVWLKGDDVLINSPTVNVGPSNNSIQLPPLIARGSTELDVLAMWLIDSAHIDANDQGIPIFVGSAIAEVNQFLPLKLTTSFSLQNIGGVLLNVIKYPDPSSVGTIIPPSQTLRLRTIPLGAPEGTATGQGSRSIQWATNTTATAGTRVFQAFYYCLRRTID